MTKEIYKEKGKSSIKQTHQHELVLINDEVHSVDYVAEALIEACNHTIEQAIQCTLITHYKGKCDVMKGELIRLKPARKLLVEKELRAIII